MIHELTERLTALGLSEEMATKAIETFAEYAKSKLPEQFHATLDDVMDGKTPDLGGIGSMLGGLKGLFGGK